MMGLSSAMAYAKGMLERGEVPDVEAANVAIVKMMGVRVIGAPIPRSVRLALLAAVKVGELGRLPKSGLAPEVFFHKNAKGSAIAAQERILLEKVEALRKVFVAGDTTPTE